MKENGFTTILHNFADPQPQFRRTSGNHRANMQKRTKQNKGIACASFHSVLEPESCQEPVADALGSSFPLGGLTEQRPMIAGPLRKTLSRDASGKGPFA
jgi:hypothetical protein